MPVFSILAAAMLTNVAELAAQIKSDRPQTGAFDCCAKIMCIVERPFNDSLVTLGDATGFVLARVKLDAMRRKPQVGDVVRARGRVIWPDAWRTEVWLDGAERIRHEPPAEPTKRTIPELLSGTCDWQPARVLGEIRDAFPSETSANWVIMSLIADGHAISVSTPLNGASTDDFRKLIGHGVSVDGFANPTDGSLRIYMGRIFHCPGIASIHVKPETIDPFDAPPLEALRFKTPDKIAAHGRIRVSGRVSCTWGDGQLILRRSNGEPVQAVCETGPAPKRGDFVEIAGFPQTDLFHITLIHAQIRPAASVDIGEPAAREISARDILVEETCRPSAKIHLLGRTVRLRVRVRNLPDDAIQRDLMLVEDGAFIVPVDVSAVPDALRGVHEGCQVALTGTCVFETQNWRDILAFPKIHGFRLILREPGDLVVTANPPWWTPGRLLAAIGLLFAALVGIFMWNRALNRLAERRGRQLLREQLGRVKADLRTSERTRLAVELHDSLAQNLTGVSMEIETAERCCPASEEKLSHHLSIADAALKSCRNDLRNTLWDLRNQALDERSMDAAIHRTLLPHLAGVTLHVRCAIPRHRLSDNVAHDILRIIRELTLNGIRHGGATEIRVAGSLEGRMLRLSVADNGCGFDPESAPGVVQGHFGLQGVRERLRILAGRLDFAPRPTKGAKAIVTIPLPDERKEQQT